MSKDGLCAIVTGSASGLGAATAAILAKGGARIVVNYSSSQKEAEQTADLCRTAGAEVVVVEGAGGFLVPLNSYQTGADLAVRLGLPMVLVVGMRLGCLNHALLTRRQIEGFRLRCAGWVANCILPDMPYLDRNVRALEQRLDCPLLGVVPFRQDPSAAQVAKLLSLEPLSEATA